MYWFVLSPRDQRVVGSNLPGVYAPRQGMHFVHNWAPGGILLQNSPALVTWPQVVKPG